MTTKTDDLDASITRYLNSFLSSIDERESTAGSNSLTTQRLGPWGRWKCCGSSRSLYCPECVRTVVPVDDLPPTIRDGTFRLPFDLDVVLQDRRTSATGLHAVALLRASAAAADANGVGVAAAATLIDVERGEAPPQYDAAGTDGGKVCLLFPSPGESVPLASVAANISRLVVLDCKWTRSSARLLPELVGLQKVHLTSPPTNSHYWRWHNAGPGMLSTIEAIYCAAAEVAKSRRLLNVIFEGVGVENDGTPAEDKFLDLLWLFGLQRSASILGAAQAGRTAPSGEAAKEERRSLRRQEGTEKQIRDRERGQVLREECRRLRKSRGRGA